MRYFRLAINLLLAGIAGLSFAVHLRSYLLRPSDQATTLLMSIFGVAALVGIASVVTLAIGKGAHFYFGVVFLGLWACLMAMNAISELASGTNYGSISNYALQYGLMIGFMALAIAGIWAEARLFKRGDPCVSPATDESNGADPPSDEEA